jgi:hypothetical protein
MSFADIAKETGKRWKELPDYDRIHNQQIPAANRLREYKEELEVYKQTENYRNYQTYLEEFNQGQHGSEPMASSYNKISLSPIGQEEIEAIPQDSFGTEDLYLEDQLHDSLAPVKSGMKEMHLVLKSLGTHSPSTRLAALPPEDLTTKSVEAFLRGTGSLLYLWSQDEALDLIKSAYHPQSDSTPVHKVEVFAMSAVGSRCDAEFYTTSLQEKYLYSFLCMLSLASNMSDLHRMRLFACLAICRFTDSTKSARIFICK